MSTNYTEKHKKIILKVLEDNKKAMTPEQISVQCRLRFDQVWRRMSDLAKENKVVKTHLKAVNSSGKFGTKWALADNSLKLF